VSLTLSKSLLVTILSLSVVAFPVAAQNPVKGKLGKPSATSLASAREKEDAMRRPRGPASVTLNVDEMASLVEANLQPEARRALDSVGVRLEAGRLTLQGQLITAAWGADVFGPLVAMFNAREPVFVSGPARATAPGVIAWEPDSFIVRNFTLPQSAIPMLVKRLTGASDGAIPIAVPPTVTRIKIESGTVTFSRR